MSDGFRLSRGSLVNVVVLDPLRGIVYVFYESLDSVYQLYIIVWIMMALETHDAS